MLHKLLETQCKGYVNRYHKANSSFALWNFLDFPHQTHIPSLVESPEVEPMETDGWAYKIKYSKEHIWYASRVKCYHKIQEFGVYKCSLQNSFKNFEILSNEMLEILNNRQKSQGSPLECWNILSWSGWSLHVAYMGTIQSSHTL